MIVVAGATGMVGGAVLRELQRAVATVTALVRDPARAREQVGRDVELRRGDLSQPETLGAAFAGARKLFLVAPLVPELAELESNAVDAAAAAGVEHVVKLSTAGVAQPAGAGTLPRQYPLHQRGEEHLERSGMRWTHLRPAPFMQNTLAFAPAVAATGGFRGAWGEGRMAYVDVRDVAAVAAAVLIGEGHQGEAYELTGPAALSPADVAAELSRATGRVIRYDDAPPGGVRAAMLERGASEWFADAMVEVMEHVRAGAAGEVTPAVSELLGREPRSYAGFAREFASSFA